MLLALAVATHKRRVVDPATGEIRQGAITIVHVPYWLIAAAAVALGVTLLTPASALKVLAQTFTILIAWLM
jgi:hypothetical protein